MSDTTLSSVKCPECKITLNDEAAYNHHRRIHDPIPEGQLCELGCGQPATAKHVFDNKLYFCTWYIKQCPSWVPLTSDYNPSPAP